MTALVFMDTETTGLALTDDIWEFAGIRREEDGSQTELHLFIEHDVTKCHNLPPSFHADHGARWDQGKAVSPGRAAHDIGDFMAGAHIVGAVPNFDTERISLLLRRLGYKPQWHYHLIDVENLAVGFLARAGTKVSLPWDSDELSTKLGIDPPTDARHTAMGDALWAMAIYDRVTWS
jgi:DNA polymerase III epsilon subunit-like protein